ncbi:hypothetical protein CHL76_08665 [Marinococcus halophilus]|uniref:Uncharacterized protein n=1 Tax=Marinococcus halophilus TaxID=1371 RepID=A0A510Y4F7_MARHA|nr:YIP1 family protein [Marinococcus halophilus]OZT80168.1 hypothetical protein CHL76_08665 [Marinococcus halophilus]GEK58220.1 hypothetical protein MHA01_11250 [Marinococcus halophilus]
MFTSILQLPFQPRKQFAQISNRYSLVLVAVLLLATSIAHTFITNYISLGTNQSPVIPDNLWFLLLLVLLGGAVFFILPLILKGATRIYDHSLSYQKALWVNILAITPTLFLLPFALIGLFLFLTLGHIPSIFSNAYNVLDLLSIIWTFVITVGMVQVAVNTSRPRSLTISFTYLCFTILAIVAATLFLGAFIAAF